MKYAKDYRQYAYKKLSGNWLSAVIISMIATILGGNIFGGGVNPNLIINQNEKDTILQTIDMVAPEMRGLVLNILSMIAVISLVYLCILMIVGGCVRIGNARFQLDLVGGNKVEIGTIFSGFHRFKTGFGLQFLTIFYIFMWSLLFIIPGIIALYKYSMAPFILAENPDMTANEAITASKELMKGNKGRFFCLQFSFIGWSLLAFITCGVGYLFLGPYMEATSAAFYCDIKNKNSL